MAEPDYDALAAKFGGKTVDYDALATKFGGQTGAAPKAQQSNANSMPANAGLASLVASVVGTPVDAIQNVANLGIAGYGAAKTALTGKPGPELISGMPGGSENIKGMLRQTGVPGLNPDNPTPDSKMGTAQYEFTARGGVIPGGALSAAGSMIAEKIGGPQWAGVGALAPTAALTAFNAARAPGLAREQAQNQVRDATLRDAQKAGYVAPPSDIQPTALGNAVEGFAGKAPMRQGAEIKNQQITTSLVRKELEVPEHTPITLPLLNKLREQAAEPYRVLAAIDPEAKLVVQQLKEARQTAKENFRHADMSGDPTSLKAARAAQAEGVRLEKYLDDIAVNAGKPQLVPAMREARTYIAKTYDAERALNMGNGQFDAHAFGAMLDRGAPLSGNFETIAKFAEAFPRATREASKVPAAGVSGLNAGASAILAGEGYRQFGWPGVAAAALPYVRGGVRSAVLSRPYQDAFAAPSYTPNMQPQSPLQAAIQQAIIANQAQK